MDKMQSDQTKRRTDEAYKEKCRTDEACQAKNAGQMKIVRKKCRTAEAY